jgi:metallophosphoesterase (TIGR00282 family)
VIRILFVGDIVGRPGRRAVRALLPEIVTAEHPDLIVANGENAAGGFGISAEVCQELLQGGIDVLTLGNHTWDNREVTPIMEREPRLIRPANYPPGTPGSGHYIAVARNGARVAVLNLLGVVFLESMDCPFRAADELLATVAKKADFILVDVHAEATSEKVALGWYLDGRVTAVIGTHTHVATADERVLPQGTAYITDAGMTGPVNSVLGIDPQIVLTKFLTKRPVRFEVASGPVQLDAVLIEAGEDGKASAIRRITRRLD